jgi:hypothetical protein
MDIEVRADGKDAIRGKAQQRESSPVGRRKTSKAPQTLVLQHAVTERSEGFAVASWRESYRYFRLMFYAEN